MGSSQVGWINGQQCVGNGAEHIIETDNGETVVRVELIQNEVERTLCLLDFLTRHAAGAVDDKDDILGQGFWIGGLPVPAQT